MQVFAILRGRPYPGGMPVLPSRRVLAPNLLLFLLVVGGLIALSFVWRHRKEAEVARTFPLPSGSSFAAFDPFGALPAIQAEIGSAELVSIDMPVVKRDGTVDLTQASAPPPWVTYMFFASSTPSVPSAYGLPETRGTQIRVQAFDEGHVAAISQVSATWSLKFRVVNKGLIAFFAPDAQRPSGDAVAPGCALRELWERFPDQGRLLPDERAQVRFDARGYAFRLPRLEREYLFDHACLLKP